MSRLVHPTEKMIEPKFFQPEIYFKTFNVSIFLVSSTVDFIGDTIGFIIQNVWNLVRIIDE